MCALASGSWGLPRRQRPSVAAYVAGTGPMDGATATRGRSCWLRSPVSRNGHSDRIFRFSDTFIRVFFVVAFVLGMALSLANDSFASVTPLNRIGVRIAVSGRGEFFDIVTGEVFTPRGNKYAIAGGTQGFTTFNVGMYDASAAEVALSRMQNDGYNTVRIHIDASYNSGTLGFPDVDAGYMTNVIDFLHRANAHGIYVLITNTRTNTVEDFSLYGIPASYASIVNSYPSPANVASINRLAMHPGNINAMKAYSADVIRWIKHSNPNLSSTILAYEPLVEPHFYSDAPPFSLTSGFVTLANGKTYDMGNPASRQLAADESAIYWANHMTDAVKEVDPALLVGSGVWAPIEAGRSGYDGLLPSTDHRSPFRVRALNTSDFDFLDLHASPNGGDVAQYLAERIHSAELDVLDTAKPRFFGEYIGFKAYHADTTSAASALRAFQLASCPYVFQGWILGGGWDSASHLNFAWHALDDGGVINSALAPVNVANACPLPNDAIFEEQTVSTVMIAGQTQTVSVKMKNVGSNTWTSDGAYRLISQSPQNNTTWGLKRIALNPTDAIASGQAKLFSFTITAPSTAGTYNFQWKMFQIGFGGFGVASPNIPISVVLHVLPTTKVKIFRVGPDLTTGTAPLASVWLDSNISTNNNPASFKTFSGTHTAYASVIPGYRIFAGVCTFPSTDSGCTVTSFSPVTTCTASACSIAVGSSNSQVTKVSFQYTP
jgi:hypothetical protein